MSLREITVIYNRELRQMQHQEAPIQPLPLPAANLAGSHARFDAFQFGLDSPDDDNMYSSPFSVSSFAVCSDPIRSAHLQHQRELLRSSLRAEAEIFRGATSPMSPWEDSSTTLMDWTSESAPQTPCGSSGSSEDHPNLHFSTLLHDMRPVGSLDELYSPMDEINEFFGQESAATSPRTTESSSTSDEVEVDADSSSETSSASGGESPLKKFSSALRRILARSARLRGAQDSPRGAGDRSNIPSKLRHIPNIGEFRIRKTSRRRAEIMSPPLQGVRPSPEAAEMAQRVAALGVENQQRSTKYRMDPSSSWCFVPEPQWPHQHHQHDQM